MPGREPHLAVLCLHDDGALAGEPPGRLLILGGGYVGCEMATAWQALGSQVTLFQRGERLLDGLEPAAAEAVTASLRARGVEVRLECEITAARRDGAEVVATTSHGDLRGDELLVAVGRRARTRDIGLDTVGLEPGSYLDVDATLRVDGLPWLYGVGDVNGLRQLTHMGKYQARQAGAAIVARAKGEEVDTSDWSPFVATADEYATPSVVFTIPQVASVGRTAADAEKAGLPHRVVQIPLKVAGSSLFADDYDGTAIMVVDTDEGEVRLTARHAVAVCTGSEAAIPPVDGLADVDPWTPREATSAKEAPGRLLILGGGYVGCEMATAWQALGSHVTIFQRGAHLLEGLEPAAADAVTASPAAGSRPSSSRSPRWKSVTCDPSACQAVAISQPT